MFGSPETTAGGRALKFYASTRIDVRRIGKIKEGEEVIGSRTKATVVKNKVAPPFRVAEFDIMFNQGHLVPRRPHRPRRREQGILDKSGTWLGLRAASGSARDATARGSSCRRTPRS